MAPAAYKSWRQRALLADTTATFAEGLATRSAFALPQQILWELLDDFVLVSDAEMRAAIVLLLQTAKTLAEPAGAAPLAAALKLPPAMGAGKIALILSGGNITPAQLAQVLASA